MPSSNLSFPFPKIRLHTGMASFASPKHPYPRTIRGERPVVPDVAPLKDRDNAFIRPVNKPAFPRTSELLKPPFNERSPKEKAAMRTTSKTVQADVQTIFCEKDVASVKRSPLKRASPIRKPSKQAPIKRFTPTRKLSKHSSPDKRDKRSPVAQSKSPKKTPAKQPGRKVPFKPQFKLHPPPVDPRASYEHLSKTSQESLFTIVHFIHVHHVLLQLSQNELLTPVEKSILSRSGKPYTNLLFHLSDSEEVHSENRDDYLRALLQGVEDLAASGKFRDACVVDATQPNANQTVHPWARPAAVHDSRGLRYVWLRGTPGVSTRFLAGDVVLKNPLAYAEWLRQRGGRKDVFVSGWISSRVEAAERKCEIVKQEFEKEELLRAEEEKREQLRKLERERRAERMKGLLGEVVQGGRRRRVVTYAEVDEEDEDGEEEDEEDEEDEESEVEISEGESDDVDEEILEEGVGEDSSDGLVAVGRVRVQVSERAKRAERRAKRWKFDGKRLRSRRVMDDVIDEGFEDRCRRSKRLRGIKV